MKSLSGKFSPLPLGIALFALLILSRPAAARVLLKPNGQNAMPLRTKSLQADVIIHGQFATTRLEMIFQNEMRGRREVEFIYTVPPHTVMTYFAYWFGAEKAVARVVEKERAAAIYQRITTFWWPRDPALIELIGKNTFRARIFPVAPNADLKVEMRMVQVLPSSGHDAIYDFPLRSEEKGKGTLDNLNLNVQVKPDAGAKRVINNYNLPVSREGDGYRLRVLQRNYRAPMDLRLRLVRRPASMHAALYAAPSGGRDGFFALALTPDRSLRKPQISIRGVRTYQVVPGRLPDVKAGDVLTIYGRYKGSGQASVRLTGWSSSGRWSAGQNISFGSHRANNNLATKLWAARRIETLSASEKNRDRVVALSQRFTLPSKWTSWLAIPNAEREVYKIIQNDAEIDATARRLAGEIAVGSSNSRSAQRLRRQLEILCRKSKSTRNWTSRPRTPDEALAEGLRVLASRLAEGLVNEQYGAKPNAARLRLIRGQMQRAAAAATRLNPRASFSIPVLVREAERAKLEPQLAAIGEALAREIDRNRENSETARRLWARLERLRPHARRAGLDAGIRLQGLLQTRLESLALKRIEEQHRQYPDTEYIKALDLEMERLVRAMPGNRKDMIKRHVRYAEGEWIRSAPAELASRLVEEQHKDNPDEAKIAWLQSQLERTVPRQNLQLHLNAAEEKWLIGRKFELAETIAQERSRSQPDAQKIAVLQQQLNELTQKLPRREYWQEYREAWHAMDQVRRQLLDEARKHKPDAAKISRLKARVVELQRRHPYLFRADVRPDMIEDTALARGERLIVRAELDKAERELLIERAQTAPARLAQLEAQHARLVQKQDELRARMGDPLISIEAPADAAQVIALLPSGEIKRLILNTDSKKWEARFDIPTYAREGQYSITVVIVLQDGMRQTLTIRYHVDVTPPHGNGQAEIVVGNGMESTPVLRLELDASDDTTRVFALLPWQEKVELKPSTVHAHRFFALTLVPPSHQGKAAVVTFLLTDKAHNRTSVTVDMTQ
ncbi:MAG TPA: VIT domain-containing protein [Abditibacteriaceae bacterium]|nr:VIT domain-containing protein [Abditibacteriaceae bacterium]